MRVKVVLVCEECLSRNYTTEKNKLNTTDRVIVKKFCKRCNKHTIHKETKQLLVLEEKIMAEKAKQIEKKSRIREFIEKDYKYENLLLAVLSIFFNKFSYTTFLFDLFCFFSHNFFLQY